MKRADVNAIRTSHYPPHPRVLDLADELGLWVVLECDLETHGFVFADWAGNPSDDPRVGGGLPRPHRADRRARQEPRQRRRLVARQRGRHRPQPRRDGRLGAPSRPEPPGALRGRPQLRLHRPLLADVPQLPRDRGHRVRDRVHQLPPRSGRGASGSARKPLVLCEYVHAMGNGPGGVRTYDDLFEEHPRLHGGLRLGVARPRAAGPDAPTGPTTTPTAATSARSCTTATSSWTAWSCPTARRPRAWPSGARSTPRCAWSAAGRR